MTILKSLDMKSRILVLAALLVLTMLLLGAGRITEELRDWKENRKQERKQWSQAVMGLATEIPLEYRDEWKGIAETHPQLLLDVSTTSLTTPD